MCIIDFLAILINLSRIRRFFWKQFIIIFGDLVILRMACLLSHGEKSFSMDFCGISRRKVPHYESQFLSYSNFCENSWKLMILRFGSMSFYGKRTHFSCMELWALTYNVLTRLNFWQNKTLCSPLHIFKTCWDILSHLKMGFQEPDFEKKAFKISFRNGKFSLF